MCVCVGGGGENKKCVCGGVTTRNVCVCVGGENNIQTSNL